MFGLLVGCEANVDQEGMTMHQEANVLIFFNVCLKRAILGKFKFDIFIFIFILILSLSSLQ